MFDPGQLRAALAGVPEEAWSLPSTYRDTGVHHGYRRVVLVSAGKPQPHAQLFEVVWEALTPVADAWLSWIEPGGFIVPHRDAGPWRERWQVPIEPSGQWCGQPTPVEAFTVRHWEPHMVTNRGPRPRIHIVVDRDIRVGPDPEPFATFDIPGDMADLIERIPQ